MAFVVVEKGNSKDIGKTYFLEEHTTLLGRGTSENDPDIALIDDYVSRRHAEIYFDGGLFKLRDLNSTNGTSIDGQRIEPGETYQLKHDSLIGLAVAPVGARVLLRFKESPRVSTSRIELENSLEFGPKGWLRIDEEKREVWVDEKQLVLSRKEYDLIVYLQSKAGKICPRDELISQVWPEVLDPTGVTDAAIDQLIHRLRLKVEPDPAHPTRLISRKGFGYLLV